MASPDSVDRLRENVARVRQAIGMACDRANRDPQSVRLVAVTKYVDLEVVRGLLAAGVTDFGENRVQQLATRATTLGARLDAGQDPLAAATDGGTTSPAPRWHMIGHLQRNKVKAVLPHARIVHSVDSGRLAAEIGKVAAGLDIRVDALIEVNVSGEASKFGVTPDDLPALADSLRTEPHIRLRGLMTMAPFDLDPEHARPYFARLRTVLERLRETGAVDADGVHLSMGMSQDYAVAIEEGATLVRVGSALFEGLPTEHAG